MTYKPLDATSFEVGTMKPYAGTQFYGGTTKQAISFQVKQGIRKFLYKRGDKKKGYTKKAELYADKLEPLLKKRVLTTKVGSRPFVGIFQALWRDMLSAIQEHFDKYAGNK
jgi:phage gpG-like protein